MVRSVLRHADAQNRPAIVEFNGTKYGYLYNQQGDVIGLIDSANTEVVKYTYDAWGKPLAVTGSLANTIGYYNPFRYRGYVYDVETGLYYLRSRYYNPRWGRFVNADTIVKGNLFGYCENSPLNQTDQSGKLPSGSFDMDYYGISILWHWLYGNGKDMLIVDDNGWSNYLNRAPLCSSDCNYPNSSLQDYMISKYRGINLSDGEEYTDTFLGSLSFLNGEGIIGYNYLHGSNKDVGGFSYTVTISMKYGYKVYDFDFTFNDKIDPNEKYASDMEKVRIAKKFLSQTQRITLLEFDGNCGILKTFMAQATKMMKLMGG